MKTTRKNWIIWRVVDAHMSKELNSRGKKLFLGEQRLTAILQCPMEGIWGCHIWVWVENLACQSWWTLWEERQTIITFKNFAVYICQSLSSSSSRPPLPPWYPYVCSLHLCLWEPTVQHRELYSVLCGDLNGKEIQKRGDIYIHIADSLCCTAETNTIL